MDLMYTNRRLILPYAAPYFAYVFIASAFKDYITIESNYLIRLVVVALLIVWFWKYYFPLSGPKSSVVSIGIGIIAGILGFILWILLLGPFVVDGDALPWSNRAFFLRAICAGLIVPVFEELFVRGFILRFAFQWARERKKGENEPFQTTLDEMSVNDVKSGSWSWPAVIISIAAFTSGHHLQEWLAAVVFSSIMAYLWIVRKDLISCIVAHSVTNISLALYVFYSGQWNFW